MTTGTRRVRLVAFAALIALVFAVAACSDEEPAPAGNGGADAGGASPGTIEEGLKIAFLPKQVNNPYFDTSDNKGGKVAVEEFKGVYSETGPSEASPSAQVSYINTLS
jgi:rhamnose transport system substrate-binding protein